MSPRSVTTVTEQVTPEVKRVKVPEDFSRWDYPLGLTQQWMNIYYLGIAHVFAIYFSFVFFTTWDFPHLTCAICITFYGYLGGLGTTVGCHRYWTHKTFKATLPLQILLMIMQTVANQYPIWKWTLDHRVHHKYTDTNSDPHNSKRGFWFSHMGWLFLPKHPELEKTLETFDMPDLVNDPIVRFQSRWYWTLLGIFHYGLPTLFFYSVLGLPLLQAIGANYTRYVFSLHVTWTVNSFAHIWGDKPYDKNITPVENRFVSFFAIGEGWHNYHHTFPWDYKASEFGWKINVSTIFIDFFAWLGWAYDLKVVSHKMLKERLQRTGDGSHALSNNNTENFEYTTPPDVSALMSSSTDEPLWGWDDEKIPEDFRQMTTIIHEKRKSS